MWYYKYVKRQESGRAKRGKRHERQRQEAREVITFFSHV
jgi:hypothetical protein